MSVVCVLPPRTVLVQGVILSLKDETNLSLTNNHLDDKLEPFPAPFLSQENLLRWTGSKCDRRIVGDVTGLRSKRLFVAFLFAFDELALYIQLTELFPIVSRIFILEAEVSHQLQPKPLILSRILERPYMHLFKSKIEHIVVTEAEFKSVKIPTREEAANLPQPLRTSTFRSGEYFSRLRLVEAAAAKMTKKDVLILSDADEIVSRDTLLVLKHCRLHWPMASINLLWRQFKVNCYQKKPWKINVVTGHHIFRYLATDKSSEYWRKDNPVSSGRLLKKTSDAVSTISLGWHLSYMCFRDEEMLRKLSTIVDYNQLPNHTLFVKKWSPGSCLFQADGSFNREKYRPFVHSESELRNDQRLSPLYIRKNIEWFRRNNCFTSD